MESHRKYSPAVFAIMMIRNEEAIIIESIGHILQHLPVDRLLIIDNGSSDRTPDYLSRIARIDPRLSWRSSPGAYDQAGVMSALARDAWAEGAEWILPIDADEFFDPGPSGFAALYDAEGVGAFSVRLINFVQTRLAHYLPGADQPGRALETMVFAAEPHHPWEKARDLVEGGHIPFMRIAYPPKHVFRASEALSLERGCHGATGLAGEIRLWPEAVFLHAPICTFDDLRRRVEHGRRLAEADPDPSIGWHVRRLIDMTADELGQEWRSNTTRIGNIRGKTLTRDFRLRRISQKLAKFRAHVLSVPVVKARPLVAGAVLAAPPARASARPYDIEADWQLLNTCNYRCGYCFFSSDMLGEKLSAAASPATWEAAFARTGLTWLLHLTGGEPTLYPHFAALCERLSQSHFLSLNSNLTGAAIPDFAARVDPQRFHFINAGLHPQERLRRQGMPVFLRHALLLIERGFPLFTSVVATPEVLRDPLGAVKDIEPLGQVPFPKLLRGTFQGRKYPDSYTEEERRAFRAWSALAQAAPRDRFASMPEPPSIALAQDVAMLSGLPDFTGRLCAGGQRFIRLEGDGNAYRCSDRVSLGNILAGTLALRPRPTPCDTHYCVYFCLKYAAASREVADARQLPAA